MKFADLTPSFPQGAGCLLYEPEFKKFFLIQRSSLVSSPLMWGLPGGKIEDGEDPKSASMREALEETGLDLSSYPNTLLHTIDFHSPRFKYHTYGYIVDKELKPNLNWECSDFGWFEFENFPENLHIGLRQLFEHDLAAKKLKDFVESYNRS